jgi:hypothetical protein
MYIYIAFLRLGGLTATLTGESNFPVINDQ